VTGPVERRRRLRALLTPARVIPLGFLAAIVVGTLGLLTPWAVTSGATEDGVPLVVAVFTATSAVCVTGLSLVESGTYWSTTGQALVRTMIQVGGLGIATLSALLALAITRRLGLQSRLTAGAATRTGSLAEARVVLVGILRTTLVVEGAVALLLTLRFAVHYGEPLGRATWLGVFHAVSAFNNAGFTLFEANSLEQFATDEWVTAPVMVAVVLGGIGFPVILEVLKRRRLSWSVNTRLVLIGTALLLVGGTLLYLVLEWDNPDTLGGAEGVDRFWLALFMSVTARTAGFNTVDYAEVTDASLFLTNALMFVGGGSAGTAGGIKVGTLAVLVAAVLAEARGERDADIFDRRIAPETIRQALAVIGLSLAVVGIATITLLHLSDERMAEVLFEVVSATATVGLSTGITARLPPGGDWVLIVCMFVGRLGPVTVAGALALRERHRLYRLPETRPLIG
jgi:trk system potassium uptake protein TrkH